MRQLAAIPKGYENLPFFARTAQMAGILENAGVGVCCVAFGSLYPNYAAETWAVRIVDRIGGIGRNQSTKRMTKAFRKLAHKPELREAADTAFTLGGHIGLACYLFGERSVRGVGQVP